MNLNICKPAPGQMALWLAKETAFLKKFEREEAERQRRRTQRIVDEMAEGSPESRIAAAKARARDAHTRIEAVVSEADLSKAPAVPHPELDSVRIDDLETLFLLRDQLPEYLRERLKKIYAKIHAKTKKGKPGPFNVALHKNHIPVDKSLTILAQLHGINDGGPESLDNRIDAIIECGLFYKIKKANIKSGKRKGRVHQFEYGCRCQDGEQCNLCNYINISDGVKLLVESYDEAAFSKGGYHFAFTLAPRSDPAKARAVGRTITPKDWKQDNSESIVYRESRQGRAFSYPDPYCNEALDWRVESAIRRFLGACQIVFGKLVKNGWLDGIRAKVENSVEFLPFASHQHWHGVGSSKFEHDVQKMAEFIKVEVDAILARTCSGLYVDVVVAKIPTPDDLQKWIRYTNKTVDLAGAIESVYNRHPGLRRSDPLFEELYEELRRYPERSRRVFKMIREVPNEFSERGAHTYKLNRRFVRGNHKFGKGSILSEPKRHREWRKDHANNEAQTRRRSELQKSAHGLGFHIEKCRNRDPRAEGYGTHQIRDTRTGEVAAAGPSGHFGLSLTQCKKFLKNIQDQKGENSLKKKL